MFPPWFTFHITSAVNGAFTVATQTRLTERILLCQWCCLVRKVTWFGLVSTSAAAAAAFSRSTMGKQTLRAKCLVLNAYSFLICVWINHRASSLQVNVRVNVSRRLMLAHHNISCDTRAEQAAGDILANILLPCLKQPHCTHCNMSFKAPPLQMDIYPCRCELTDRCFGTFCEAVSQFSVKVTVHRTNPH